MRLAKIGEQVFFTAPHTQGSPRQTWPATVVFVHADGQHVNIGGYDADGAVFKETNVQMVDASMDEPTQGGWASWDLDMSDTKEKPTDTPPAVKSIEGTKDQSVVADGANSKEKPDDEARATADKTSKMGKK